MSVSAFPHQLRHPPRAPQPPEHPEEPEREGQVRDARAIYVRLRSRLLNRLAKSLIFLCNGI